MRICLYVKHHFAFKEITDAETPLENLCYIFITIITIITKYGLPVTKWAWLYQALLRVYGQNNIVNSEYCLCR